MDIDYEEEKITESTFPLVIIIIAMSPSNGIFKFLGIYQADVW